MLLGSFSTISVGVEDNIVTTAVLCFRQRAREWKSIDLGGSANEAHLRFFSPSALTGRRG